MAKSNRSEEVFNHETRTTESRNFEARSMENRDQFHMSVYDPLYIDKETIPAGMEYFWIRTSCFDLPDTAREIQARKMGLTPVPAERHPDKVMSGWLNEVKSNYITYRGLLLCEGSSHRMEQQRRYQTMINLQNEQSLRGLDQMPVDHHMPRMDFGTSSVSRTVSFAS